MREFYVMYRVPQRLHLPAIVIGAALFYVSCRHPYYLIDAIFFSLCLLLILRLILFDTPSGSMKEVGPLCVGFFYISGFLSFQWFLREITSGTEYLFLLYTSVWLADSAAYYAGTYFGKNKLYPAVSPNKTLEGAFGSILGGAAGALIIKLLFSIYSLTFITTIVIGIILGIAAVTGDLIESMFKRDAGVKDSSGLIPGHGGILDKIDSLLISAPVLYLLLRSI